MKLKTKIDLMNGELLFYIEDYEGALNCLRQYAKDHNAQNFINTLNAQADMAHYLEYWPNARRELEMKAEDAESVIAMSDDQLANLIADEADFVQELKDARGMLRPLEDPKPQEQTN